MKPNALFILSATFALSFVGRIAVMASEVSSIDSKAKVESLGDDRTNCINAELADAVKKRLVSLEEEELSLSERKSELTAFQNHVENRLQELKVANETFSKSVAARESQRDADIAKLAAIYEGMKPAQASEIVGQMDPKFAAGLLSAMSNEQAAQIVAAMDSEKAYLVSVILANRSQTN